MRQAAHGYSPSKGAAHHAAIFFVHFLLIAVIYLLKFPDTSSPFGTLYDVIDSNDAFLSFRVVPEFVFKKST